MLGAVEQQPCEICTAVMNLSETQSCSERAQPRSASATSMVMLGGPSEPASLPDEDSSIFCIAISEPAVAAALLELQLRLARRQPGAGSAAAPRRGRVDMSPLHDFRVADGLPRRQRGRRHYTESDSAYSGLSASVADQLSAKSRESAESRHGFWFPDTRY